MDKKALFLDRDGVINQMFLQRDGTFDSPQNIDQVFLVNGICEIILLMNHHDIPVIEISNQPGVALGKMDWDMQENIEKKIHQLLNDQGVKVNNVYRCFHHPRATKSELKIVCDCRKPNSGLLLEAAQELGIDLKNSLVLGDNYTDIEAGKKVGCKGILFSHANDLQNKLKMNNEYITELKVNSLSEVIPILNKLLL